MIKGVLFDLSGTLHLADAPIPGALSALRRSENLDADPAWVI